MQYKLEIVFNSEREFSDYLEKLGIKVKATDPTPTPTKGEKHKEHYGEQIKAISHKNKSVLIDLYPNDDIWLHGINTNKYKRGDVFNG